MDKLNMCELLGRAHARDQIKDFLHSFEKDKHNLATMRGIYIYGGTGIGKTIFVKQTLSHLGYDIIYYDASDARNRNILDGITNNNMSHLNVHSLFYGKRQNIAIIMDEVDGMNNGDKGGINNLIKLIRPKKTKKQKSENHTMSPVICVGNHHIDKKINELKNVCYVIELNEPSQEAMITISESLMPKIDASLRNNLIAQCQGDLRMLSTLHTIYCSQPALFNTDFVDHVFRIKSMNDDTKDITRKIMCNKLRIEDHLDIMNETDRTSVGLLFHENIVSFLSQRSSKEAIAFYLKFLDNICFADYVDRVTFQKQIWILNELTSLIKSFYNNMILHESYDNIDFTEEIKFTKVLTKYSTEYNNSLFIRSLCQRMNLDIKDLYHSFYGHRIEMSEDMLLDYFGQYDITKLEVRRMYRFLDEIQMVS